MFNTCKYKYCKSYFSSCIMNHWNDPLAFRFFFLIKLCVLKLVYIYFTSHIFLFQMFDGWVLKGERFPSLQDHPLPLHQRYTDYCSSTGPGAASRSSQNVAMIFFRIHNPEAGFTLAIKKLHNPFRESLRAVCEDMRDEKAKNVHSLSVHQTKCQTLKEKMHSCIEI